MPFVGQTGALACYHVAAIPYFQLIRTPRVKISGTTSRGKEYPFPPPTVDVICKENYYLHDIWF
jgi:hypothetical protein